MDSRTLWSESIRQPPTGCAVKIVPRRCDAQPDVSPQMTQSNSVAASTTMTQLLNHNFESNAMTSVQTLFP